MNNEKCDRSGIIGLVSGLACRLSWLPPLAARITLGFIFIQSGWGKLHHLDKVVEFFTQLGIPAPHLQAPFVASVEFFCGLTVLLGVFTRIASIPLIGVMIVAIVTAKIGDISELSDLFAMSEYLNILLLLWLSIKGAGAVSIDWFACRKCRKE